MRLYADYYACLADFVDDFRRRHTGPYHALFPSATFAALDALRSPTGVSVSGDLNCESLAVYLEGAPDRAPVYKLGFSRPHYIPGLIPIDVRILSNIPSATELLHEACR